MAINCQSCGKSLNDNAQFCDGCGASINAAAAGQAQGGPPPGQNQTPPPGGPPPGQNQNPPPGGQMPPEQEVFSQEDIEKNKVMAALAYFLFFLPLVACPESRFGKYHANQGLLLLIVGFGGSIILGIIPIIGWILLPFFYIAVAVFAIMGLLNGLKGVAKPLPLFGKFVIIK